MNTHACTPTSKPIIHLEHRGQVLCPVSQLPQVDVSLLQGLERLLFLLQSGVELQTQTDTNHAPDFCLFEQLQHDPKVPKDACTSSVVFLVIKKKKITLFLFKPQGHIG